MQYIERPPWEVVAAVLRFDRLDIDEYRARHGKAEGEARFFRDHRPSSVDIVRRNMLMFNGAAMLWQYALGNGTGTANTGFSGGPTLLNNGNAYIYVGDGAPAGVSGTVTVSSGSTSLTSSTSQTGWLNNYLQIVGDSSNGLYQVTGGSGTSWTISPSYGGSTNAVAASANLIVGPSHSQTALQGSSNLASQVMDSTFPSSPTTAQFNAITGATNASPVVLTVSGADISTNDICHVVEVGGNTGANGVYVTNPASASSITLLGSAGNAGYTSGGIVTKRSVMTFQATFGPGAANFAWNEWSVQNGDSSNKLMLNRRVASLGTKGSSSSWAMKVGIAMG